LVHESAGSAQAIGVLVALPQPPVGLHVPLVRRALALPAPQLHESLLQSCATPGAQVRSSALQAPAGVYVLLLQLPANAPQSCVLPCASAHDMLLLLQAGSYVLSTRLSPARPHSFPRSAQATEVLVIKQPRVASQRAVLVVPERSPSTSPQTAPGA
jgi:hypothetical protein